MIIILIIIKVNKMIKALTVLIKLTSKNNLRHNNKYINHNNNYNKHNNNNLHHHLFNSNKLINHINYKKHNKVNR